MRKCTLLFGTFLIACTCFLFIHSVNAQVTFPINGIAHPTPEWYAFTHATIIKDAENTVSDATLLLHHNKIAAVGKGISIPAEAIVIDCSGKYIYPSFIDLYSNYGMGKPEEKSAGAAGWNHAIKPEVNAFELFEVDNKEAEPLREAGFGTVLTHQYDGIARGTGTLVSLANKPATLVMLQPKASANYSFSKGTSSQRYPTSLMGAIALLRQTYLDAAWYNSLPEEEGSNLSLAAWNDIQNLPQIFDANDKWNCLRADKIGDEFDKQYILKAGGNEYQRMSEMAKTNATFILPLDFPKGMDVSDPNDARYVSLADMKHWEMAPTNPAAFENAGIPFCLTAEGVKNAKTFWQNLRKAVSAGLSEDAALNALTKNPALALKIYNKTGSLENGKVANFIITDIPLFNQQSSILENWIQGEKYKIKEDKWPQLAATYQLEISSEDGNTKTFTLLVKSAKSAKIIGEDTLATKFSVDGDKLVQINFSLVPPSKKKTNNKESNQHEKKQMKPSEKGMESLAAKSNASIRLSGVINGSVWNGNGTDTLGNMLYWTATLIKQHAEKKDTVKAKKRVIAGAITYPFGAYGWHKMPEQKDLLIKNATVWTSEKEGILQHTDVLIKGGKIAAIGKNLKAESATVIDGTGMHLTPGIIDEHSHIATMSINEGGQSVTSEVRIGDNLNPDDINIYRQLSGGVTTSHILHGSANTIGGQTQLIKLRWGADAEGLKFKGADQFIKFALGENVKNTRSRNNTRFPDTRMGVEEVLTDAFTRARDYENAMKAYAARGKNSDMKPVRKDLELEALVDIMNEKMFITCHSYVQSEIIAAMRVAEKFDFRFNTFTHILEGYKVADKLKAHGANASTFSDWWNYKMEVIDAIPQNASIMHKVGLNVAINSDDAEMARRLNQEAAKSIKYGLSEQEALNMVTINPATMLHIQGQTGSIKVGKDADLVLWNHDPLSIYAIAQKTIVDGIVYFDRKDDSLLRKEIQAERNRLIQKLSGVKKSGAAMAPAVASTQILFHCEDHGDIHGNEGIEEEQNQDSN